MAYKFIYVDDTQDQIEVGTIDGLQEGNEIEINFIRPSEWETLIQQLISLMPVHDGIILDLRLNGNPYQENKYAQYRGSTLAQELRTLSKEEAYKKDYPIILISADNNLERSLDQTSLDLFDYVISKNKLGIEHQITYSDFKNKLKWLADGYKFLNQHDKTISAILAMERLPKLDSRFIEVFSNILTKPTHIVARFLVKQIIERPSFLINEAYLSARLGIDTSSKDWPPFRDEFLPKTLKYSGAFSNYYARWWMSLIDDFWQELISAELSLRNTPADEKVAMIIAKSGLKELRPITKPPRSKSDTLWVVCKATGLIMDTVDGFLIAGQDDKFSWQEPEYISTLEALRPTKNIGVSSIEYPRLQKLKELYEQQESRVRK